ncbi:MAG: bifunctional 4-hydroxy-3-methylbut-2-enyl diphosphate reductase/30S ribosomal protein S1 [Saccharofermentanales bacterium]|jgi:small subunit ribosomal protein S1
MTDKNEHREHTVFELAAYQEKAEAKTCYRELATGGDGFLRVAVASSAGFCPGVRRAINMAKDVVDKAGERPVVMLGAIVHNEHVIADFQKRGVSIADHSDEVPDNAFVIIRAHGVAPGVVEDLNRKGCEVIDGTCPFVGKVQQIAADAAKRGDGIIITGAANHPEVIGVIGYSAPEKPVLIETPKEIERAMFDEKAWVLVSQTTFSANKWQSIRENLENKIANLSIFDTICYTTAQRQSDAKVLAASSDVVLVLGSETSSNTAKLVEVCRERCPATHLISVAGQVDGVLSKYKTRPLRIGVTTGASTPDEMIREVIERMMTIEGLTKPEEQPEVNSDKVMEAEVETAAEQVADIVTEEVVEEVTKAVDGEVAEEPKEVTKEDAASESNADICFEEFIDNIPELQPKTIVTGKVVRYDDEYVYVDVRDKSEGKIPIREMESNPEFDLDEAVKTHREIDVYIRSIRSSADAGKEILLSIAYVDTLRQKEFVKQAYEEKTPVPVRVVNVVGDGVIASYGRVEIYVHRTQLELSIVDDLEPYRDQAFDILITQFDDRRRRLRVSGSRRSLLERERRAHAKQIWATIEVGSEYTGIVRNLTNFGAFVDIGGVDGLVHVSEISWQRIRHPSEVLSVGDKVDVFVLDFDRAKKRISLGYRRKEDDPYANIEERFPVGAIVRGVVVRMFPFGAFINIAPGVDALCHISQISTYHLNKPGDVLAVGMEVDARVVEVSDEARRISISIRDVEPINPAPDSEIVIQQQEQRQQRESRRRGRRRRSEDSDGLPTSYVDRQARSAIGDMAEITTVTKAGSKLLDSLKDEAAGVKEKKEIAEPVAVGIKEVEPVEVALKVTDEADDADKKAAEVLEDIGAE